MTYYGKKPAQDSHCLQFKSSMSVTTQAVCLTAACVLTTAFL
jgi:hypothetical protein